MPGSGVRAPRGHSPVAPLPTAVVSGPDTPTDLFGKDVLGGSGAGRGWPGGGGRAVVLGGLGLRLLVVVLVLVV